VEVIPRRGEVPIFLQPDVFDVERPADTEIADAFVTTVVGAVDLDRQTGDGHAEVHKRKG
jgi:hypothetical protein